MRCGSGVQFNEKGVPVTHQCSHYFGRTMESVRFEPENCDTLCHGCHRYWEKENREAYRDFKVKQLTEDGFIRLTVQANTLEKKDRKMAYLKAKALLDSLEPVY